LFHSFRNLGQADSITLGAAADVLPWAWAVQYLDAGDAGVNVVAANAAMGVWDAPLGDPGWGMGGGLEPFRNGELLGHLGNL